MQVCDFCLVGLEVAPGSTFDGAQRSRAARNFYTGPFALAVSYEAASVEPRGGDGVWVLAGLLSPKQPESGMTTEKSLVPVELAQKAGYTGPSGFAAMMSSGEVPDIVGESIASNEALRREIVAATTSCSSDGNRRRTADAASETAADLASPVAPSQSEVEAAKERGKRAAAAAGSSPPATPDAAVVVALASPKRLLPREGGSRIRLRPFANEETPVIAGTVSGSELVAIGTIQQPDGQWWQVRLPDGRLGFIRGDLVTEVP